jgi:hypothetical protein
MSIRPHRCEACQVDGVCDAVVPYVPEQESLFAVAWKCPRCGERSLAVSPLGPWLVPGADTCLQCGEERRASAGRCDACGFELSEVLAEAGAGKPDDDLLAMAREDFARGTCRRGLTLVNHVLQRNPASREAWLIKGQFFEYLGFHRASDAAQAEAVRRGAWPQDS